MTIPKKQKGRSSNKSAAQNIPGKQFTQLRLSKLQLQRRAAFRSILTRLPGNSAVSQRARMLTAMQEVGNITTFEAMRYLDVFDPRPRIFELRRDGNVITTIFHRERTESGIMHRVGLYFISPSPQSVLDLG